MRTILATKKPSVPSCAARNRYGSWSAQSPIVHRCFPSSATPSDAPARYVLELNAGQAEALKLQDGVELKFGPGIPVAK